MVKKRLGKGLGALISENNGRSEPGGKIIKIFIDDIEPNPFQPRENFEKEALNELCKSVKDKGIIQPVTVRQIEPEKYQLVTGERRWRAARMAGLKKIPAIVKNYTDQQMMEIALVENLQREDLNPIEEAQAYRKMIEEFSMTQEDVAGKVGKSRSSVANVVRLLNLSPKVQVYVSRETLSMGHARALLAIKDSQDQIAAADYVIEKNLSVRETEKYINRLKGNDNDKHKEKKNENEEVNQRWIDARNRLAGHLGTEVKIRNKKNKKELAIVCSSFEDMEKILSIFGD